MFDNSIKRIGFACKYIDSVDQIENGIAESDDCKKYNCRSVTLQWLNKQNKVDAETRLYDIMRFNILSLSNLVCKIASLPESLRMVRISSTLLPMYTHPKWEYFWKKPDVVQYLQDNLSKIGQFSRIKDIRLSFHPGQFCIIGSDKSHVIDNAIQEFEYHVDVARYMGFAKQFQDMKINIHVSGAGGANVIRQSYNRLSEEAKRVIILENDEFSHNISECIELTTLCPIVLDIHHYWISSGKYVLPSDSLCKRIADSWNGVRLVIHYSVCPHDICLSHQVDVMPDMTTLLNTGFSKTKLRAHSDMYWNTSCNDWALSFLDNCDIMCEAKGKNLASMQLYDYSTLNKNSLQI